MCLWQPFRGRPDWQGKARRRFAIQTYHIPMKTFTSQSGIKQKQSPFIYMEKNLSAHRSPNLPNHTNSHIKPRTPTYSKRRSAPNKSDKAQMLADTAQSYGDWMLSVVPRAGAWWRHCRRCTAPIRMPAKQAERRFQFSPFLTKAKILFRFLPFFENSC